MEQIIIPENVLENIRGQEDGQAWLEQIPSIVATLAEHWQITLHEPFGAEASCSWVAPCTRSDGSSAVFKLGWLHMEAEDEIEGLRFWNGDPTARLIEADVEQNAMLLERCEPGTVLREQPEERQDEILATMLRRLWRTPSVDFSFRPLSQMVHDWMASAQAKRDEWPDEGLAEQGLEVYQTLLDTTEQHVLLATDLHAGNVLRAEREPWLVIDPKPFVGDPAYDATQHLLNCWDRLNAEPLQTIQRFAGLLGVDANRVREWLFARLATMESGDPSKILPLIRTLAP